MGTRHISLRDALEAFVEEQVARRGFGSSSEYVCELIRKDRERRLLRNLLLGSAASVQDAAIDGLTSTGCATACAVQDRYEYQAGRSLRALLPRNSAPSAT
jgi:antitoxin ParD1/3/4